MRRAISLALFGLLMAAFGGCPSTPDPATGDDGSGRGGTDGLNGTDGQVGPAGSLGPAGADGPVGPAGPAGPVLQLPSLVGAWRIDNDTAFFNGGSNGRGKVEYLDLRADGTATLHQRDANTHVLASQSSNYLVLDDVLILDYSNGALVFHYETTGDGAIHIENANLAASNLTREPAVPAEFVTEKLAIVHRIELALRPDYSSGLAFDGQLLWYAADTAIDSFTHGVKPDDGVEQTKVKLAEKLFAMQGDNFWTSDSSNAYRYTSVPAKFDTVPVFTDTGVRSGPLAFDAIAKVLYVYGDDKLQQPVLQRWDAESEPDLRLSEIPFLRVAGMSFDAGVLWILGGDGRVAQLDPLTGQALRSFDSLDRTIYWRGIAVTGDRIFLLGRDAQQHGILIETRIAQ